MSRHPVRLAIAVALLTAGLVWIVNTNPWSGPTLLVLSATHGVHTNDWVSVAVWGVAFLIACPSWSLASWRRLQRAIVDRSA